jgi:hypothetical protein
MDKPDFLKNMEGIECPSIDDILAKEHIDKTQEKNDLVDFYLAYIKTVYLPALKKYNGGKLPLKK